MIKDFISNLGQSVYMTELYDFLELDKSQYSRFVKSKIIDNEFAEHKKDYSTIVSSENVGKRGKFRNEYIIHIDFAKKICMVSKSKKGEEVRNNLVELTKQVENSDLLTHEQVIKLNLLKSFFMYVDNQKEYENKHKDFYAMTNSDKRNVYAEFYIWRNKILSIEKERIELLIKQYCVENQKPYPKKLNKSEKINLLDNHMGLRNAVFDFLSIKGEINALKLANLIKQMADVENLEVYKNNENNLFQYKKVLPEINHLKLNS